MNPVFVIPDEISFSGPSSRVETSNSSELIPLFVPEIPRTTKVVVDAGSNPDTLILFVNTTFDIESYVTS